MADNSGHNGKPRLVIQRVELENFKSYAGVQHIGPFHKSFSAIVGPNGSGKSNVIDAMLFVFGKRAKQLRLNKVSELIHNSTHHQKLEAARVSVYFEEIIDLGEEAFEAVPNSELVVSRTAHRNNTSNYYLNGKKSNFTEVTNMLKEKGVDLNNNRFLILQGEVEQISMMKPKAEDKNDVGLLEYLEDIMGTDQYKEPIEEAAKELEELNESRQAVVQRAKLSERERDALQDAKDLAEEYQKREVEELQVRGKICTDNMLRCATNAAKITEQLEKLQEKLEYEQEKLGKYSGELKEAKSGCAGKEKERNKLATKMDTLEGKIKELERSCETRKEKEKHLKKRITAATAAVTTNERKLEEAQAQTAAAQEELPAAEEKVLELQQDLQNSTAKLEEMQEGVKDEVEALRKKLSEARAELAPWNDKMQAIEAARELAATELQLLKERSGKAAERLAAVRTELAAAEAAAADKRASLAGVEDEITQQRAAQEAAQAGKAEAEAEAEALEKEVAAARGDVFALRSSVENEASRGAVVKGLMDAQARGELQGIYGRLGDLGAIDGKYDAAVSNASGALDNIVVESTTAAQHAVEFLRRGRLGVATFLILEKQAHFAAEAARAVQPPEGVPRLFDLVKCQDARLRPAFFYALRNTLVTDGIDQAMRIAYKSGDKRWGRVVTLKGELIAENGTMSGGGSSVRTGKMRLGNKAPAAVDPAAARADLKALEKRLADAERRLAAAQEHARSSARAAADAAAAVKKAELTLQKMRLGAESDAKKAQELTGQLAALEDAAKVSAADATLAEELQGRVEAQDGKLAAVQRDAAAVQQRVAAAQLALDNAGGEPLRQQRDLVATIKQDIKEAEKAVARQRVLLQASEKAEKKFAAEAAKKQKEAAAAEAEAAALLDDHSDSANKLAKWRTDRDALQQELSHVQNALDGLLAEFESRKADVGKIRAVEVQIQATMADQQALLKQESEKEAEWRRKVASLRASLQKVLPAGEQLPEADDTASITPEERQQLEYRLTCLEAEMRDMQQGVDLGAIEAFCAKDAELTKRLAEVDDVTGRRNGVRDRHEALRKRRLDEFMAGFLTISLKLKEMYQMITLGGDAELELVDSLDPFSEGIVFSVRPPKKSWKNIANLSGGEKTLSSLSLVFALHHFKPTPLYFMDEIDAALDFKNVSIVAHYVKERTKNAQFVVISLRNNMFELADHLVGIYKTHNCTKSVTINPNDFIVGGESKQADAERPLLQQQRVA